MKVLKKINSYDEVYNFIKVVEQGKLVHYSNSIVSVRYPRCNKFERIIIDNSFGDLLESDYFIDSIKWETKEDGDYLTFNLVDKKPEVNKDKKDVNLLLSLLYKRLGINRTKKEDINDLFLIFPEIGDNDRYLLKLIVALKGKFFIRIVTTREMLARFNEQKLVEFYDKNNIDFEEMISKDFDLSKIKLLYDVTNENNVRNQNKENIKPIEIEEFKNYFGLVLNKNLYKKENQLFVCPHFIKRYTYEYVDSVLLEKNRCDHESGEDSLEDMTNSITRFVIFKTIGEYVFTKSNNKDALSEWLAQAALNKKDIETYKRVVLKGRKIFPDIEKRIYDNYSYKTVIKEMLGD